MIYSIQFFTPPTFTIITQLKQKQHIRAHCEKSFISVFVTNIKIQLGCFLRSPKLPTLCFLFLFLFSLDYYLLVNQVTSFDNKANNSKRLSLGSGNTSRNKLIHVNK